MTIAQPVKRERSSSFFAGFGNAFFSKLPIVISFISLLISTTMTFRVQVAPGELNVYPPSSFCISRGYPSLQFPSDYLLLPITVENTGRGVKTIDAPTLVLTERNSGREVIYTIAGTVPNLNRTSRQGMYEEAFSLSTASNSMQRFVAVFHTQNWWDDTTSDYNFQFKSGEWWDVRFVYVNDQGVNTYWNNGAVYTTLRIFGTVDNLNQETEYTSECFGLRAVELTPQPKR